MQRNRRLPKPEVLLALLAVLPACGTTGGGRASAPETVPPATTRPSLHQGALRTLQVALNEGEDELAARIVASLKARPLSAQEREVVESAERVLKGRALVRGLELALVTEPVPGREEGYALVLVARSRAPGRVRLHLPPASLKRLRVTIDGRGVEGMDFESRASFALADLELLPGLEQRTELLTFDLSIGRALGVRQRWAMETRSGEVEADGERYPAAQVRVEGCERERYSPLLPAEAALATALADRLESDEPPTSRGLIELAVRTPREEREEALRALTPVVDRLARTRPERVAAAEPALRWLTRNRDLGPDAAAWARYLKARAAAGAPADDRPVDGLDLPARSGSKG